MLGISATTVYVLARRGDLPAAGWPLRIPRSELGPFLEGSRVRPGDLGGSNRYAGRPTQGVGEWYRNGRKPAVENS